MGIQVCLRLCLLGVVLCVPRAMAHPTDLLLCGHLLRAQEISASLRSNGMYSERYDTNGDGVVDLEILSVILATHKDGSVEHSRHPTFYIRDVDYDHAADVVFIDKAGNGNCNDIVEYADLNAPQSATGTTLYPDGRSL